jgi:hypothetical protein
MAEDMAWEEKRAPICALSKAAQHCSFAFLSLDAALFKIASPYFVTMLAYIVYTLTFIVLHF